MQSKATSSRGRDNVRVKELGEGTSQRERGYRWVVESRLDGKRSRKFFRHGEIAERNTHVALVLSTIENLAKADRSIITDNALLEEASRASKELQLHGKNISDAASFYLAHLKSEATRDSTPISDVIKRFMDEKDRLGISVSHRRDLRYRLRRFESDHGASPVSSWNRRAITRWILGLELGPQSQVNYRAVLQAMFEFAVKEEIIPPRCFRIVRTSFFLPSFWSFLVESGTPKYAASTGGISISGKAPARSLPTRRSARSTLGFPICQKMQSRGCAHSPNTGDRLRRLPARTCLMQH